MMVPPRFAEVGVGSGGGGFKERGAILKHETSKSKNNVHLLSDAMVDELALPGYFNPHILQ